MQKFLILRILNIINIFIILDIVLILDFVKIFLILKFFKFITIVPLFKTQRIVLFRSFITFPRFKMFMELIIGIGIVISILWGLPTSILVVVRIPLISFIFELILFFFLYLGMRVLMRRHFLLDFVPLVLHLCSVMFIKRFSFYFYIFVTGIFRFFFFKCFYNNYIYL